jgi:hypothetical protein
VVRKVGRLLGLIGLVPEISQDESELLLVSVIHNEIEVVVTDDVELIAVGEKVLLDIGYKGLSQVRFDCDILLDVHPNYLRKMGYLLFINDFLDVL